MFIGLLAVTFLVVAALSTLAALLFFRPLERIMARAGYLVMLRPVALPWARLTALGALLLILAGCAASRSDLGGAFEGSPEPRSREPVTVAFVFTHTHQNLGLDVVPKLHHPNRYANGFYDLFRDALPELSNVRSYDTYTDAADDVTSPERRELRDSLTSGRHDYTIQVRFRREASFARQALGTLTSAITLTLLPVPFTRRYSVDAEVTDRAGRPVEHYQRDARVTNWVQLFLIFAYPFHPEERKTEEVYLEFLHDIFREIEADGVLAPPA